MIHFGTSGWRGIVGQEFTFRNVRLVLEATYAVLQQRGETGEVLVSYDTRLLSEKFAREAVAVYTHHRVPTVMSDRDLPSPCLAWAVRERGASLGVMFTASHNSAEYNGVKLYTRGGTPATRDFTGAIEREIASREADFDDFYVPSRDLASSASLAEGYLKSLERGIDWEAIRAAGLVVAVDPLFGTSREFLDRVLIAHDVPTYGVHSTKDPYFGGYSPECTPANMVGLRERVRRSGADLGLATDGDADRFGVLDSFCRAVPPNLAVALLVDYLVGRRGVRGPVGRTVATTRLVDRIALAADLGVVETPVGFNHFVPFMLDGGVAIATEESAGLGISSRLPERDGIFAALLMVELLAVERTSLSDLIRRLFARYGTLVSRRVQLPWNERTAAALERLRRQRFTEFAGLRVERDERIDGLLLELEGSAWVLVRQAGTEPRLRLYAEGTSSRQLRVLVRELRRLVS
jgi:phosphomannomutase